MSLASQTEAIQTRITDDNNWEGGERVQVGIDGESAVTFVAAADGVLTPVNSIWWHSATQTISARAWYPDMWIFPTDQSAGTREADFVFAPTVSGITFRNAATKPLTFYHRTAMITVNLIVGEGVGSVTGAVVAFYGYTSGVVDTSAAGDGAIDGFGDGWVTPYNAGGTYVALLIPRDMSGERFIKITLDGFDYFYTPAAGEADLKQGQSHTYNITLNKTGLDVTVTGGDATWGAGDEHTVVGDIVKN